MVLLNTLGAEVVLVAMFFWLIWQMGSFFKRNMPRRYTLDAIPADVLPKVSVGSGPQA